MNTSEKKTTIYVIFSDTKEIQTAQFDSLYVKADHIELTNVCTYVGWHTAGIEETGADLDGNVVFNQLGLVYFEAVDRIEVIRDGQVSVLFEKSVA